MRILDQRLRRALDGLPEDEPGAEQPAHDHEAAQAEVSAVRLLDAMLQAHPASQVLEALLLARRVLRQVRSPELAAERMLAWRQERLADPRKPSKTELAALGVAAAIGGAP